MDTNQFAVTIIANAGDSKSCSMEAIDAARRGNFSEAETLLEQGDEALTKAHKAHSEILVREAREGAGILSMILIHASNHFSGAEITRDFAKQIITLYKEIKNGL